MANKSYAAQTDIIDRMKEEIAAGTGIPIARDAWENAAPEDYGVIELGGTASEQWADGRLIDATYNVTVTIYLRGDSDEIIARMQTILEEMEAEGTITAKWTMEREFQMDVNKTQWVWKLRVWGPIVQQVNENGDTQS